MEQRRENTHDSCLDDWLEDFASPGAQRIYRWEGQTMNRESPLSTQDYLYDQSLGPRLAWMYVPIEDAAAHRQTSDNEAAA